MRAVSIWILANRESSVFSSKISRRVVGNQAFSPVESGCGLKSPEPAGSSARIRSFTTSPARISPNTEGTNALLPGTCLRWVHFRAVPGGQMQCVRQLMDISSKGVIGGSWNKRLSAFSRRAFSAPAASHGPADTRMSCRYLSPQRRQHPSCSRRPYC